MTDMTMPEADSRGRLPLWGKLALGCLAVVVIGTATCAGVAYVIFKRGGELVEGMVKDNWGAMRRSVDLMMTDEGARKLYAEQPGLVGRYPTEEVFLAAVHKWRRELEPVPERIPILLGKFNLNRSVGGTRPSTEISYENGKGARLRFRWERSALVDIEVDRP